MSLIRCAFGNIFLQFFPTFSLVLKNLVGRRFLMLVSALGMAVAQVQLYIAFMYVFKFYHVCIYCLSTGFQLSISVLPWLLLPSAGREATRSAKPLLRRQLNEVEFSKPQQQHGGQRVLVRSADPGKALHHCQNSKVSPHHHYRGDGLGPSKVHPHPCRHLSQASPYYPHHHGHNLGIGKGRPSPSVLAAPAPHPWLHRCLQPWPG